MIPMLPKAPNARCTWRRVFLEATGNHEVHSPDLDELVAPEDPHDIHAVVHLYCISPLRNRDGRANGFHSGGRYRGIGSPGADQQGNPDSPVADFIRSTDSADSWS